MTGDKTLYPEWTSTKTPPEDYLTVIARMECMDTGFVFASIGFVVKGIFNIYGEAHKYDITDFDDWAYIELRDKESLQNNIN